MAAVIADRHLEAQILTTKITKVTSEITRERHTSYEWTVVQTEMNHPLQVKRPRSSFSPGAPISMQRTRIFGEIVGYHLHRPGEGWRPMESEKQDYRPLPYIILVASLLLLVRNWPEQVHMVILAIFVMTIFVWVIMLIATNAMKLVYLFNK